MRLLLRRRRDRIPPPAHPSSPSPYAVGLLVRAQGEALRFGHDSIGTEHCLLALLDEPGTVAAQALRRLGLTTAAVGSDVLRIVGLCRGTAPAIDADALRAIGIDLAEVRERAEESFGPGALDRASAGRRSCGFPVEPRLKRVLERARDDAAAHNEAIAGRHVLVAIITEGESVAARLLAERGHTAREVLEAIRLAGRGTGTESEPG